MPTTDVKSANAAQRPRETEPSHPPLEKAVQLSWLNDGKRTFTWESESFLQCVFVLNGQIELFLPEHGKSTSPEQSWFTLSLDGWTANCRTTPGTRALILECEESLDLGKVLMDSGFSNVVLFAGGMTEWTNAGHVVER